MIGNLILGRYEVISVLGQGGMGVVYRCIDRIADVEVAVKGLVPELASNVAEMAEMKANFQLVSSLRHPAIGGLRNLEQDENGTYYLVMDYIAGTSLSDYIHNHIPSLESTFIVLDSIAGALDYAHENGIIHRDIKPDNVKIDPEHNIKVLDFGIAVAMSSRHASNAGGTPEYMSPEQWFGEPQSGATDEYALAVLAYRMMYGKIPFSEIFSTEKDFSRQGQKVYLSAVKFPSEVSEPVKAVFKKALAKQPQDRYASSKEFVDELAYATGFRKREKPHKSFVGWIAAGFVLVAAGGVTAYLVNENRKAKARVRVEKREIVHTEIVTNVNRVVETVVDDVRIRELEAKLKDSETARKEFEKEKAEAAAKARAKAEAERAAKEKAAREAKDKGEREAKAKLAEIPPELAAKLIERHAGFWKLARGNSDQNDFSRMMDVWNSEKRTAVLDVTGSLGHRDYNPRAVPRNTQWSFGTYMQFKPGVKYVFRAQFDNCAKIVVDQKTILQNLQHQKAECGEVFFPDGGWHQLTIALNNGGGYGCLHGEGSLCYRENDGEWQPFTFDLKTRKIFRTDTPPGFQDNVAPAKKVSPQLVHRWSFNGNSVADRVGRLTATRKGKTHFTQNMLVLDGGEDNRTSRADLGRAIPDDGSDFTIEMWAALNKNHRWSRIFDIRYPRSDLEYDMMSWSWTYGTSETANLIQFGRIAKTTQFTFEKGRQYHLMLSVKRVGVSLWRCIWYVREANMRNEAFVSKSCDISEICWKDYTNFYLGHSDRVSNHDAAASYNEVRIWDMALTEEDFERNHKSGPDITSNLAPRRKE